jgi:hypothetical protein
MLLLPSRWQSWPDQRPLRSQGSRGLQALEERRLEPPVVLLVDHADVEPLLQLQELATNGVLVQEPLLGRLVDHAGQRANQPDATQERQRQQVSDLANHAAGT